MFVFSIKTYWHLLSELANSGVRSISF